MQPGTHDTTLNIGQLPTTYEGTTCRIIIEVCIAQVDVALRGRVSVATLCWHRGVRDLLQTTHILLDFV